MTERVIKGSGNVFRDIGLENADEILLKAQLTHQIYKILKERGLSQHEAAKILVLKQPDVADLMNGMFKDFSVDLLLSLLARLHREVEIVIKPLAEGEQGAIRVSAL